MNVDPLIYTALQHFQSGAHKDAEALCHRILQRQPREADAWHILGLIARDAGKNDVAIGHIGNAIALNPNAAIFRLNFGSVLHKLGRFEEAARHFTAAIALQPNYVLAYHNLAQCLQAQGRLDEAIIEYQRVIALDPNDPVACNNLGTALKAQGRHDQAVSCFERALTLKPDYVLAHCNLGITLQALGRLDEAIAQCEQVIAIAPAHSESHNNMAVALQAQGRMDEALASYELAVKHKPDYHAAHSNMLLALNYAAGYTPGEIYSRHLRWTEQHAKRYYPTAPRYPNITDPERRLRIGYVSPDYRRHAVAYFIDPVLTCHDRDRFDVFCYSNVAKPDEVTNRLQQHTVHWRDIYGSADEEVQQLIQADGIDILVDLAGHTGNNRLLLFARKPAPVQVSWLGYLSTTGLATMDYRVADSHTMPPGLCEPYYTETLVRLPDTFVCYRAPAEAVDVGPLPALTAGHITFGSFNNFAKVTPDVMRLWAQVLEAVPGSRLLLKTDGLSDSGARNRIAASFAQHGVDPQRLELLGRDASFVTHFERYNQVDIGLDPFPCNGGTTSCDSMWMGVPVISLAGDSFISRMGVSMLTNVGLTGLIADTQDDYIRIAGQLAGDLDYLRSLREGLRERMRSSPLMDAPRFTRSLEQAFRDMWTRWCSQNASV
jgi:predicted O-linked N-acetylglucosamine transferase (SPINDLY family)